VGVNVSEEVYLVNYQQKQLRASNYAYNDIAPILDLLEELVPIVYDEEEAGIDHALNHDSPLPRFIWNNAEETDRNEARH